MVCGGNAFWVASEILAALYQEATGQNQKWGWALPRYPDSTWYLHESNLTHDQSRKFEFPLGTFHFFCLLYLISFHPLSFLDKNKRINALSWKRSWIYPSDKSKEMSRDERTSWPFESLWFTPDAAGHSDRSLESAVWQETAITPITPRFFCTHRCIAGDLWLCLHAGDSRGQRHCVLCLCARFLGEKHILALSH